MISLAQNQIILSGYFKPFVFLQVKFSKNGNIFELTN